MAFIQALSLVYLWIHSSLLRSYCHRNLPIVRDITDHIFLFYSEDSQELMSNWPQEDESDICYPDEQMCSAGELRKEQGEPDPRCEPCICEDEFLDDVRQLPNIDTDLFGREIIDHRYEERTSYEI